MANNTVVKRVSLCSINICGLSDRSKLCLDKYNEDHKFDVVAVQETGTSDKTKLNLENMVVITDTNNAANKGSALFVNNKHSVTQLQSISKLSKSLDSTWGLTVINKKRYIIGSVYVKLDHPEAIQEVITMLNSAHQMINKFKAAGIMLIGDFNARHISWGDRINDDYGKKLVASLDYSLFSIHTSTSPTFLSSNGRSFIDLVIVSNNLLNQIDPPLTDDYVELFSGAPRRGHVPLLINFSHKTSTERNKVTEKINIEKMNWFDWTKEIEEDIDRNENTLSTESDPHKLWKYLDKILIKATEKHGELKRSSIHSKPFWTKHLTELSKNLRQARKSYKQRNTDQNLNNLNTAKDAFDAERKRACEEFILKRTANLNSVQAIKFWKEFNKMFKKKTDSKIDPLQNSNGGLITESEEIEQTLFSTFFEGKHLSDEDFDDEFFQTVNGLYGEIIAEVGTDQNDEDPCIIDLNREISINEIVDSIKHTKCEGKSFDDHKFHPSMFKHLGSKAKNLLHKIFNLCLVNTKWVWDSAEVIFLKKAGKDSYAQPGSYRPISISAYIGKMLETIISIRIQTFLDCKKLYDPDQEGFMKLKNTIRYLNRLHLGIKADQERKLTILCLFIDFEKAFDSIWKKGMITKLSQIGISGNILKLIDKFLTSRKVTLNINGDVGNPRQCFDYGLPQGSVLSPILFRIFLMDLIQQVANIDGVTLFKFADDGSIKVSASTTDECLKMMDLVLKEINLWIKKWRLKVNCQVNKTEIICFGTADNNRNNIPKTFKLGENTIKLVSKTKVLGLIIDETLSYSAHSAEVFKSLNATWADICNHSHRNWGFNVRTMVQLLKTLFIPKLQYAGHIYINKNNLQDLKSLWYKVLKSTVGATFNISASIAEVILGLPPIEIQTQTNRIKHYLKLNISPVPEDRYKEFISNTYDQNNKSPSVIHNHLKDLFSFLTWKLQQQPSQFSDHDMEIISNRHFNQYFELTRKSCTYTKDLMKKYTETLWKKALTNQFQTEGIAQSPNPSCSNIPIPAGTTRKAEVQMLQMLYKNNLTNNFLYSVSRLWQRRAYS